MQPSACALGHRLRRRSATTRSAGNPRAALCVKNWTWPTLTAQACARRNLRPTALARGTCCLLTLPRATRPARQTRASTRPPRPRLLTTRLELARLRLRPCPFSRSESPGQCQAAPESRSAPESPSCRARDAPPETCPAVSVSNRNDNFTADLFPRHCSNSSLLALASPKVT